MNFQREPLASHQLAECKDSNQVFVWALKWDGTDQNAI